jgi:hypothetical protein
VDSAGAQRIGTDRLIENVERTLDRMQASLDNLRRDAQDPYRFPRHGPDDDRPRAA